MRRFSISTFDDPGVLRAFLAIAHRNGAALKEVDATCIDGAGAKITGLAHIADEDVSQFDAGLQFAFQASARSVGSRNAPLAASEFPAYRLVAFGIGGSSFAEHFLDLVADVSLTRAWLKTFVNELTDYEHCKIVAYGRFGQKRLEKLVADYARRFNRWARPLDIQPFSRVVPGIPIELGAFAVTPTRYFLIQRWNRRAMPARVERLARDCGCSIATLDGHVRRFGTGQLIVGAVGASAKLDEFQASLGHEFDRPSTVLTSHGANQADDPRRISDASDVAFAFGRGNEFLSQFFEIVGRRHALDVCSVTFRKTHNAAGVLGFLDNSMNHATKLECRRALRAWGARNGIDADIVPLDDGRDGRRTKAAAA